jgi:hypothetical protein
MAAQKSNQAAQNFGRLESAIDRAGFSEAQKCALLEAFADISPELDCARTQQDTAREILKAIDESSESVQHHIDLRLLELRVAYEKANADMLLRLGGVVLVVFVIAVASARFMGIIY